MSRELSHSLAPRHIAMISIGGIIGAGLFVGSSAAIATTGPAIVISYLVTGVAILLVMRMLGDMATSLPGRTSFTEFAREALGPGAGFVTGWLYWYFWIVVVPIEAIAGAHILQAWIPVPAWALGLALMAVMTAVNLMSARSYGEFEFWFASIKVAAIIAFIVVAAGFAFGWTSPHGNTFANLTRHGGFMPFGFAAVLAGATAVFFSLTGAEIIMIAAAESREPAQAIARMTTTVIVRILSFYVGSMLLILSVIPWNTIPVGESPFILALRQMGFEWAGVAMSVIILTAVLSALNSAFYVCSRVLFVLAQHGDAPQSLVELNSRRVPERSVWIAAAAGVIGTLIAVISPSKVFAFLVNASGALIVFVYMIISFAHLKLRRERRRQAETPPAARSWLFPWANYAAILFMIAILIAMALTPARANELYVSLLALAVAVIAYLLVRARRRDSVLDANQRL